MTTAEIQSSVVAPAKNSKRIKYREMYVEDRRGEDLPAPVKNDVITLSYKINVEKKAVFGTPERTYAIYDEEGVPGNMNENIKHTQGWRGTSYGMARYACGNYRVASAHLVDRMNTPKHLEDSEYPIYKVRLAEIAE